MLPQFDHKVLSSFTLWLDNKILSKGQAFTNVDSNFYRVSGLYANYYTYGNPYGQMVYDSSVSGANILSGIYANNTFVTGGQSGCIGVNYDRGHVYFNTTYNNISGSYAIKDFNITLTEDQEEIILFKNKYLKKSKFPQTPTGVPENYLPFPVIFVKNDGGKNDPFALGGLEQTSHHIRCIILSDSLFNLHAVESILKDSVRTPIALFEASEMPFNSFGGLKSGVYNYTGVAYNKINEQNFAFIEDVSAAELSQRVASSIKDLADDIYFNFIDMELTTFGNPRNR